MLTCRRPFAANINTSQRRASNGCDARDTTLDSCRLELPWANTSRAISIATIATGKAMYDFDKHLSALSEQTVLCIGDLMLDEFVYGDVSRISPEAPTPVIAVKRAELMIGGAGNVARNLVALGVRCIFVGVVGDDEAGGALTKGLHTHPLIEFHLVVDGTRQTTRKVRFVSEHHSTHLLRADWESMSGVDTGSEDALIGHVIRAMSRVGAVVLSDYAKGAL